MSNTILLSVFAPDRTGLVAAITATLFDLGANLASTNFSVLGNAAEFTAVAEIPVDVSFDDIQNDLRQIEVLENAKITISPFDMKTTADPTGQVTHKIAVSGGDRPGLIARLCEVFVQFKANIVRMNAERVPSIAGDQYIVSFFVWLPEDTAQTCLATISNTAGGLNLSCTWENI